MVAAWITVFTILVGAVALCGAQSQEDDFDFTNGPVPNPFQLNQHYPDRPEIVECRPIRLHITRGSQRFSRELAANDHPRLQFASSNARIMSLRLLRHLNQLAEAFHARYTATITVIQAWTEFEDNELDDPTSLHYEGEQ